MRIGSSKDSLKTAIDDDTDDGRNESTIETSNTVRAECLPVNIHETIELPCSSTLGGLRVIGETSTSIVERVDEEKRRCTSCTTRCNVASEPFPVTIVLLETEQGLEVVL